MRSFRGHADTGQVAAGSGRLHVSERLPWLWDHLHGPAATKPLLVMDMYEHSYQMDFGAATAKYIDAFFQNIRWDAVLTRLQQARQFARG